MKKLLIVLVLVIVSAIVIATQSGNQQTSPNTSAPQVNNQSTPHPHDGYGMEDYAAKGRIPAYLETAPNIDDLPPTLSPELFTGNQRLAYKAAKEIPQTLAQLPCYCHCDRGHGHRSLHSCFESEHGENCGICIGEALLAHRLQKRGLSAAEIRKEIIAAYGSSSG
jgi:hypothetical protein